MYTHIVVGTNNVDDARSFYDAVFGALGGQPGAMFGDRVFYKYEGCNFAVGKPFNGTPATFANGGTIGFPAPGPDQVDAWHAAGLAHGGSDEGAPGHRPDAPGKTYAAYLRDPDGNKLCVSCQMAD